MPNKPDLAATMIWVKTLLIKSTILTNFFTKIAKLIISDKIYKNKLKLKNDKPNFYIHNPNNKSNGMVQFMAVTTNIIKIHGCSNNLNQTYKKKAQKSTTKINDKFCLHKNCQMKNISPKV